MCVFRRKVMVPKDNYLEARGGEQPGRPTPVPDRNWPGPAAPTGLSRPQSPGVAGTRRPVGVHPGDARRFPCPGRPGPRSARGDDQRVSRCCPRASRRPTSTVAPAVGREAARRRRSAGRTSRAVLVVVGEPSSWRLDVTTGTCPEGTTRELLGDDGPVAEDAELRLGAIDEDQGVADLGALHRGPGRVVDALAVGPVEAREERVARVAPSCQTAKAWYPVPGRGAVLRVLAGPRRRPDRNEMSFAAAGMTPMTRPGTSSDVAQVAARGAVGISVVPERLRLPVADGHERRLAAAPVHRHAGTAERPSRGPALVPDVCVAGRGARRPGRSTRSSNRRVETVRSSPAPRAEKPTTTRDDGRGRDAGARGQAAAADDPAALRDHGVRVDVDVGRPLGIRRVVQQRAQLVLERVGAHRTPPSIPVSWVRRVASPREAADFTEPTEMLSASAVACSDRSA